MVETVKFQVPDDYGKLVLAPYACHDDKSRGRLHSRASSDRPEFEHDHSRLTHLDAWRRMEGKTQVFIHLDRGDHIRTRASHTNEVVQLSRSVARRLGLHPDLAQTIAQAHDMGHPPFGHGGEDVLNELMQDFGGFDHNAQAIRVLTKLQGKYIAHEGVNLSWEALEGIAKHNGPVTNPPRALKEYNEIHDLELDTRAGGEAQVAAVCDDIAYNNHDIEDGLRSGLLDIEHLLELPLIGNVYHQLLEEYPNIKQDQLIFEAKRRIITMMVDDLLEQTTKNIKQTGVKSPDDIRSLDYQLVAFSPEMQNNMESIRAFLMPNMYRHDSIVRRLEEAKKILRDLFNNLINNPANLPQDWQEKYTGNNEQKTAEAVCDYVAGMTDRHVYREHERLLCK
jgi:dGTPase